MKVAIFSRPLCEAMDPPLLCRNEPDWLSEGVQIFQIGQELFLKMILGLFVASPHAERKQGNVVRQNLIYKRSDFATAFIFIHPSIHLSIHPSIQVLG